MANTPFGEVFGFILLIVFIVIVAKLYENWQFEKKYKESVMNQKRKDVFVKEMKNYMKNKGIDVENENLGRIFDEKIAHVNLFDDFDNDEKEDYEEEDEENFWEAEKKRAIIMDAIQDGLKKNRNVKKNN